VFLSDKLQSPINRVFIARLFLGRGFFGVVFAVVFGVVFSVLLLVQLV
jgi:hypothetical protein